MSEMTKKRFVKKSIDQYLERRKNLYKDFTSSKMKKNKKHNI